MQSSIIFLCNGYISVSAIQYEEEKKNTKYYLHPFLGETDLLLYAKISNHKI